MLAQLYVDQMLIVASLFLETLDAGAEERAVAVDRAARQMRLISIGRLHWNA